MKSEKAMRAVGLLRKTKLSFRAIAAKSGLSLSRIQELNAVHGIRQPKKKTRFENALENMPMGKIVSTARRLNEIESAAFLLLAALRKRERKSKKKPRD